MDPVLAIVRGLIGGAPLLSVAIALCTGVVGAWTAHGWTFETFERPAIVKATQNADAATYEAAAAAAQKAAELAKFKAIEAVTQQAAEQQAATEARQAAELEQLNKEIDSHERQLRSSGHSCPVTQSDIDYINRLRQKP